jgi:hypothetical protein
LKGGLVRYLKAFAAGFISTLVFHQGVLALLWAAGVFPRAPFNLTPVPPLGVPAVVSLAFWGGVWGIVLWELIRRTSGAKHWTLALIIGALGPSLVAWFVVMPLKGMAPAGGFDPKIIVGALLLNGAWGLGVALLMRVFERLRR